MLELACTLMLAVGPADCTEAREAPVKLTCVDNSTWTASHVASIRTILKQGGKKNGTGNGGGNGNGNNGNRPMPGPVPLALLLLGGGGLAGAMVASRRRRKGVQPVEP